MRRLTVEEFSVIKFAEFTFSGMNVIIGPQATGKSLLCKLAYFFLDIASAAVDSVFDEVSIDEFAQIRAYHLGSKTRLAHRSGEPRAAELSGPASGFGFLPNFGRLMKLLWIKSDHSTTELRPKKMARNFSSGRPEI